MPVIPEFQSTQRPGEAVRLGIDAFQTGASLMERKQRLQIAQQEADQRTAEFQAKLPVIIAQRAASVAQAHAAVTNAALTENLRTKAAVESGDFNKEFLDAIQLSDFNAQSAALAGLQAKVSYMSILPEYKGFVDTVNKARLDAHGSAMLDQKLEEQSQTAAETARTKQKMADAANQTRLDAENIKAGAKASTAQTYTSSRERMAAIQADTKLSVEDKRAAKQGIQLEDLQRRAIQADQDAADAAASGDERSAALHRQVAASFRDAVQKTTTFAGTTPSAPRDASQDPRPTPRSASPAHVPMDLSALPNGGVPEGGATPAASVAPTKVQKDATTVKVGDKQYPIFKDKNGNRAYKIDGHFVPVQTD